MDDFNKNMKEIYEDKDRNPELVHEENALVVENYELKQSLREAYQIIKWTKIEDRRQKYFLLDQKWKSDIEWLNDNEEFDS